MLISANLKAVASKNRKKNTQKLKESEHTMFLR